MANDKNGNQGHNDLVRETKSKTKRDEEKKLSQQLSTLQEQLRANFTYGIKTEMDRVKNKLKNNTALRTQGEMLRIKARWYVLNDKKIVATSWRFTL